MELDARVAARHHFDALQHVHERYAAQLKELTMPKVQRKAKSRIGSEAKSKSVAAVVVKPDPTSVAVDGTPDTKPSCMAAGTAAAVDNTRPPAPSSPSPTLPICTLYCFSRYLPSD